MTIILGFQVLIALPFLMGESTVEDYIIRSKLTGAGRNGIATIFKYWDFLAALPGSSILWTFVPPEIWFEEEGEPFSKKCKAGILFCNVWNFFVR